MSTRESQWFCLPGTRSGSDYPGRAVTLTTREPLQRSSRCHSALMGAAVAGVHLQPLLHCAPTGAAVHGRCTAQVQRSTRDSPWFWLPGSLSGPDYPGVSVVLSTRESVTLSTRELDCCRVAAFKVQGSSGQLQGRLKQL